MLVCPKCNSEYQEGCTVCSDCQCELIEKIEVKEDIDMKMDTENKKSTISVIMIICLFLGGSIISFIGLAKGLDMASSLSRPRSATGWTISDSMILACTYTPVMIEENWLVSYKDIDGIKKSLDRISWRFSKSRNPLLKPVDE